MTSSYLDKPSANFVQTWGISRHTYIPYQKGGGSGPRPRSRDPREMGEAATILSCRTAMSGAVDVGKTGESGTGEREVGEMGEAGETSACKMSEIRGDVSEVGDTGFVAPLLCRPHQPPALHAYKHAFAVALTHWLPTSLLSLKDIFEGAGYEVVVYYASASSSPSRCSATSAPSSGGSASPATTLTLHDKAARCRLQRYYREAYYDREHPRALQGLRAHRREHRDHDSPRLCEPEREREHEHAAQWDRADAPAKPQHTIAPDGAGDGVERIYTPGALCTLAAASREMGREEGQGPGQRSQQDPPRYKNIVSHPILTPPRPREVTTGTMSASSRRSGLRSRVRLPPEQHPHLASAKTGEGIWACSSTSPASSFGKRFDDDLDM
ncbi:uncharacterized protein BXZ73DRAFT_75813 [Epithele typhae]|uniref:uncharacterized protein n=1 Tax=Epithele typhae TaxID=378194 RepID=UPI0020077A20|nr:uncharacterized protein BXZ73DRAFT_75813 [Epithele typhae]KAH9940225.1 hypothetical protein BXZ73DRAFT_75813 [Epithele typhae]